MATVLVRMGSCNMDHRIAVTRNADGTMSIAVDSPCAQVRQYVHDLEKITDADLMDRATSRIFSPDLCKPLTLTCLVPDGVLHAAYLESGMLARSLAFRSDPDSITFIDERARQTVYITCRCKSTGLKDRIKRRTVRQKKFCRPAKTGISRLRRQIRWRL